LLRLRYVARAGQVRPVDFPHVSWRITYLNDDETELKEDEQMLRGRGALRFAVEWTVLNKKVWEDMHALPPNFQAPPWESLLLDARAELPDIGPAIVLAATALEVFSAHILDQLGPVNT